MSIVRGDLSLDRYGSQLSPDQLGIDAVLLNEVVVSAVLGDLALVQHDDGIGILDCAQSVSDYDHGLGNVGVLQDLVQGLLDLVLGFCIEGACCLVQEKHLGLPD